MVTYGKWLLEMEKSNFWGSIGSQKGTKNVLFLQACQEDPFKAPPPDENLHFSNHF